MVARTSKTQITDICQRYGAMTAAISLFETEQTGWFRITFTVEHDALIEGLSRVTKALKKYKALRLIQT